MSVTFLNVAGFKNGRQRFEQATPYGGALDRSLDLPVEDFSLIGKGEELGQKSRPTAPSKGSWDPFGRGPKMRPQTKAGPQRRRAQRANGGSSQVETTGWGRGA